MGKEIIMSRSEVVDVVILLLGLIAIAFSLYVSSRSNEASWFMRSGVFGILSSVVVEYRSVRRQVNGLSTYFLRSKMEKRYGMMDFINSFEVTPRNAAIRAASYFMLFFGTVITGYGDLLVSSIF